MKIQYNRNRYLDYYTGRWLTEDPLDYIDGMNLYEYAKSNPITYTDPIGLQIEDMPCNIIKQLVNLIEASDDEKFRVIYTRRLYKHFASYGGTFYPNAAKMLEHWLGGGVGDMKISKGLITSVASGKSAYENLKKRIKGSPVRCEYICTYPPISENVRPPSGTDLFYTTGSFTLSASACFEPHKKEPKAKVTIVFLMNDPYDWHTHLGIKLCGVTIRDKWAKELQEADGLNTFNVYAQWEEKLKGWKCCEEEFK